VFLHVPLLIANEILKVTALPPPSLLQSHFILSPISRMDWLEGLCCSKIILCSWFKWMYVCMYYNILMSLFRGTLLQLYTQLPIV
jgi:hypothetical protein